jgi:hypothetical protein
VANPGGSDAEGVPCALKRLHSRLKMVGGISKTIGVAVRSETAGSSRLRWGFNVLRRAKNTQQVGVRTLHPMSKARERPLKGNQGRCSAETARSNAVAPRSKGEQLAVRTEIAGSNRGGCGANVLVCS